jgi:hypothetical protein
VQGRDADGTAWEEMATTADASPGGLALVLSHPVRIGQCLLLSLPLPKRYRQHDISDQSYRTYVLVRSTFGSIPPTRVGVLFFGKYPPRGASDPLPAEVFLLPGDQAPAPERRQFPRHEVRLDVSLEREIPGAPKREQSLAENLSKWGALVKTSLPVAKGETVMVAECGGRYRSRAEIRNVTIGADGSVRLNLLFLDGPVPDELLPPPPAEAEAGKS